MVVVFNKDEEIWVTNISRVKDISIDDLKITIRIGQSKNLLAKNKKGCINYRFTKEQVEKSVREGSIFKKSDVLKVRKVPPVVFSNRLDIVNNISRSETRFKRKALEIEVPDFPDLDFDEISPEQYAEENADMDFEDRAPALAVDPKFKKLSEDD